MSVEVKNTLMVFPTRFSVQSV